MNEVYMGYDVLGKNAKFVSSAGQYIGLSRGHLTTWVDFGEDELHMSVSPKRFESIHAIPYKDIADVLVKKHINLYFIILICGLTILSLISGTIWGLIVVALLVWAGLGSEIQITLTSGRKVFIYSCSGVSDSEDFVTLVRTAVERAKKGEVVTPPENTTGDSALDLFVMRDVNLPEKNQESWDAMVDLLHSGKTAQQLMDELCMQQGKCLASEQVNQPLFQEACGILRPHLIAGEQVLFCQDNTLVGKLKNFMALTNKRIIFYYGSSVHGTCYGKIYKMTYFLIGQWFINSLPSDTNETITAATLSNQQVGLVLAVIAKMCEEQMEPGHKIIICDTGL